MAGGGDCSDARQRAQALGRGIDERESLLRLIVGASRERDSHRQDPVALEADADAVEAHRARHD